MLFNLLASGNARREIMKARHALSVRALSNKQFGKRQARADRVKALCDTQLKGLAVAFDIQKAALDQRHEQDIAAQNRAGAILANNAKSFGMNGGTNSGSSSGRRACPIGVIPAQATPRPKSQFVDATQSRQTRTLRDQKHFRGGP